MKKIILAFDGGHFSEGAFEFARRLNELQRILLVGVFLPHTQMADLMIYADPAGGMAIPVPDESKSEEIQRNIEHFQKKCIGNGIDFRVHENYVDFAIPELKTESIYADLLILGSEMFYENSLSGAPGDYLQEALHQVYCPVIVVPEHFVFPERIVLAYDGSFDSVFAIKQFAYLFPELTSRRTMLVYGEEDDKADFPQKVSMEELLARHYGELTLYKMDADPRKYFQTWLADKKSAILVSGAYGRSGLSRMFRKSFVKDIIAEHRLPVFIAHA